MIRIIIILCAVMLGGEIFGAEPFVDKNVSFKSDAQDIGPLFFKIITALIIVSALAYIIVLMIKKYYYGQTLHLKKENKLNLLEIKRISPKLTLYRISVKDKEICLAQTDNALVVLDNEDLDINHEEDNTVTDQ